MRGLWVDNGECTLRQDLSVPAPPEGWARIAPRIAGVCGTDLQILAGYAGFRGILGHEFVGTVVQGSPAWLGRRVVGEINVGCDRCGDCRAGAGNHCRQRRVLGIRRLDGVFAECLILPEANLHEVPDGVEDATAVFTEPLAAALRIAEQVPIGATTRVLVVGAGRLGQLVARALRHDGAEVLALGRHDHQLEKLRRLGIETTREPPVDSHDLVVDCSGSPSGFAAALGALRPRGTLVLKSTTAGPLELPTGRPVVDEITILGSRCGPFDRALELLAAGAVPVLDLVAARVPLADAGRGLREARQPGVLKVLLEV